MPARPDKYEAAAAPNGSWLPAAAAGRALGVARGEADGAAREEGADVIDEKGTGAEAVTFRRSAGEPLPAPIAALRAGGWLPGPAAFRPATVPAAMTAQAPIAMSTIRTGLLGGLGPDVECLPLTPETDVLTTIRSRARASPPPPPGRPGSES